MSDRSGLIVQVEGLSKSYVESQSAVAAIHLVVKRGEWVGLIGKPGAGKSTLLKMLGRLIPPTEGRGWIPSACGQYVDSDIGLMPQLTMKENIELQASRMGISRRFKYYYDDVVQLGDLSAWNDIPVRNMAAEARQKLALALALAGWPSLVLIDECFEDLPADFQAVARQRIDRIVKAGSAVLMACRNPVSDETYFNRCLWMEAGRIRMDRNPSQVIREYLHDLETHGGPGFSDVSSAGELAAGDAESVISLISVEAFPNQAGTDTIFESVNFYVEAQLRLDCAPGRAQIYITLRHQDAVVFRTGMMDFASLDEPGLFRARVLIPGNVVPAGTYPLTVGVTVVQKRTVYARKFRNAGELRIQKRTAPSRGEALLPQVAWSFSESTDPEEAFDEEPL